MNNKSFLRILLILSGYISLNPGPVYNNQSLHSNEWNVFRSKGIHLIHLNINSLLPKIDEIPYIAERTKAAAIGISNISYVQKNFFPNVIENIFFEILLPKTTPVTAGIMYRLPSQANFLGILNMNF